MTSPVQEPWLDNYGNIDYSHEAIQPYLNEDKTAFREDLLGGKYTDPRQLTSSVLQERQQFRDQGYKGQWGEGYGAAHDAAYDIGNIQDGSVDAYGRPTIKGYQKDEFLNPSFKPGTEYEAEMIQDKGGETLDSDDYMIDPDRFKATQTLAQTQQAEAAERTGAHTYDSTDVNITPEATVKGQLDILLDEFEDGNVPEWAAPIVRSTNQMLASRGMGASSIAAEAAIQAAMEATLPIAKADAAVHAQALFTNTAAENAAKQFNAQSKNQVDQFFAQLETTVSQFNADQSNAQERFNAGEANAISKFNANLSSQREMFNVANRVAIDSSNAQWRREQNTANTAATNLQNQFNAQNLLNISNTASNNLWQEWRDQADYAFTASENEKTRNHQIALTTMQNAEWYNRLDAQSQADMAAGLGDLVGSIFTSDQFLDGFFDLF